MAAAPAIVLIDGAYQRQVVVEFGAQELKNIARPFRTHRELM